MLMMIDIECDDLVGMYYFGIKVRGFLFHIFAPRSAKLVAKTGHQIVELILCVLLQIGVLGV